MSAGRVPVPGNLWRGDIRIRRRLRSSPAGPGWIKIELDVRRTRRVHLAREGQNEATLADMERERRRGIPQNDPRRARPGGYQAVEERRSLDRFGPWEARRLGTSSLN
jgi:hypothetical protein